MKKKIYKIIGMLQCFVKYIICKLYCRIKKINNEDVWLISERGIDARDNSIHFYKYLKKEHPEINVKYIISKDSPDRKKINTDDIIDYRSFKHYILFITSGKLISTHIMGYSPNISLFSRLDTKNKLNLKGKKIFLQHGIIKDYLKFLTYDVSKMDLFICGAKPEYEYILENFGHPAEVVKYTGLARYDNLKTNTKNQILIMPTWRKWLPYVENFKKTNYFKHWNGIINNKRLIEFIEQNDIKLVFYPHYGIQKFIHEFKSNSKNIIIADFNHYDVQELLITSKLLITDYSSVFFDFAYMKKNIIYYQFDIQEFNEKHYSEGYFDYKKMGFGPVCTDEEETVKEIIKLYKETHNNSKNINNFFKLNDQKNCERIYNEIIKLK